MSNLETRFCFSSEHVDAKWRFTMEPIRVTSESVHGEPAYYADHGAFGCGRNYPTPKTAIRELIKSAACFNIQIHEIEPKPARALLDIENRAISAIADIGLETMGGKVPADLLDDNMSYFDFHDLARALEIKESDAAALMVSLSDMGFVLDTGENPKRNSGIEPTLWILADSGIDLAGALALEKIAQDLADSIASDRKNIADAMGFVEKPDDSEKPETGIIAEMEMAVPAEIESDMDSPGIVSVSGAAVVSILFTGDPYPVPGSAAILIDPQTARELAGELMRAAEAVNHGASYTGADYHTTDTDSNA